MRQWNRRGPFAWVHYAPGEVARSDSEQWSASLRFWRVGFTVHIWRHRGGCTDRWVVQTSTLYDRKDRR